MILIGMVVYWVIAIIVSVVLGSMNFGFATPRQLSPSERAFMQAVVDQCALALERARLYDAERRARAQLEARQAEVDVLYRLMEAVNRAQETLDGAKRRRAGSFASSQRIAPPARRW